jgi:hypothetical protein
MSTRNPSCWTDIHDIVSLGQDTLFRLYLAGKHRDRLEYAENALKQVAHCYDMAPPQTLGELCLELAEDANRSKFECGISEFAIGYVSAEFSSEKASQYWIEHLVPALCLRISLDDIHALRRAMYGKKTGYGFTWTHEGPLGPSGPVCNVGCPDHNV